MMKNQFDKEHSATSSLKDNFSKKLFEGNKPVKLSDFRTKEGAVRSRITKELRDYAINCEDLQKSSTGAYERLLEVCEELTRDFDKVSDTIGRMCDQINYLASVHKRFNDQCKEGKWDLMQKMYQTMSNSFSKWGKRSLTRPPVEEKLVHRQAAFDQHI
jgi:Na+/phosphate symporter